MVRYFHVRVANIGGQTLHLSEVVIQSVARPDVEVAVAAKELFGPIVPTEDRSFSDTDTLFLGLTYRRAYETLIHIDAQEARRLDATIATPAMTARIRAVVRTGDDREWFSEDMDFVTPKAAV